ncbi:hypothetical protein PO909_028553 [Leuciscus waleckii]
MFPPSRLVISQVQFLYHQCNMDHQPTPPLHLPWLLSSVIHISFFNHPHLSLSLNTEMNEISHNAHGEKFVSETPIQWDHQYTSQHGHVGSNSPVESRTKSSTFIKTSPKCVTDNKPLRRCVMTRSELGVKRLSALCKWSRTALLSLVSAIRGKIPLGLKSFMCGKLPWVL